MPYRELNVHCLKRVIQLVIIAFLIYPVQLRSQAKSLDTILKEIQANTDSIVLDSLSIIPYTFVLQIDGLDLDSSDFYFNAASAVLIIKNPQLLGKTLTTSYRTFPFNLSEPMQNKSTDIIMPAQEAVINPFIYKVENSDNQLSLGSLDKSGSISRGVNFGNSQNLGVNSNLNLQLAGKITDDIYILAAITDENIPIQPDGNTQQLQDFDQVYIQVYNKNNKLIAGDFTLEPPNAYFMRYLKRGQGGSFETHQKLKNKANLRLQGSGAISRGKFARNVFQGIEGNQGPYRLRGAENEPFIIILSGTEKVFVDGRQLVRGQENDYIINYNTAEVSFTAKEMITKDKRIVVEFQYADQNYARSLFNLETNYSSEKLKLNFNFFSEQDAKNQPLQQDLTDAQKDILRNAGNNLSNAFVNSIDSSGFNESQVRYLLTDTLTTFGFFDSVLVFSNNPEEAVFSARFSDVGQGNGFYALAGGNANGRVFEWVGIDPNTGAPAGRFEPVVILISPKQQQMMTFGGAYDVSRNTKATFELALTNNNRNTFSNLDNENNIGFAYNFGINQNIPLSKDSSNEWKLNISANAEKWDKNFREIERIRQQEFFRSWNLRGVELIRDQDLYNLAVNLMKGNEFALGYTGSSFDVGQQYQGLNQGVKWAIDKNGTRGSGLWEFLESDGNIGKTAFQRRKSIIKQRIWNLDIGYRDDFENNRFFDAFTDTLATNSYRFYEFELFVESPDTLKKGYRLSYIRRTDDYALNNDFINTTLGESYAFDFRLEENPNSKLKGRVVYRILDIKENDLALGQEPENSILGRLEYNLRLWKGAVTSSSFYEISSGLEQRQNFVFIEVAPGQGVYTWIDFNNNGVKELDEFEVAQFQDKANYIKVFTPSDEYERTFSNQFNQNVNINPGSIWRNEVGLKKFIAKFSNQTAFRISRKTNNEDGLNGFNPFAFNMADSVLLSQNGSFRNTFYFNRIHPVFGADVNYQRLESKNLLVGGFQTRTEEFLALGVRWNIHKNWIFNGEFKQGVRGTTSDVFINRNFMLDYNEATPKITFQPGTKFRVSTFFTYSEKLNNEDFGGEKGIVRRSGIESKYNEVGKRRFDW